METSPGIIRINTLEDNIIPLVSYCHVEMPGTVQNLVERLTEQQQRPKTTQCHEIKEDAELKSKTFALRKGNGNIELGFGERGFLSQ